jgi:small subunit ribosomal protein S18
MKTSRDKTGRFKGKDRGKDRGRDRGRDRDNDLSSLLKMKKRYCRFCRDKVENINYKSLDILEKMISERGKILSRRFTHNCAGHQRKISVAIKRARFLSLLPYIR